MKKILVIGGGLAGPAVALFLQEAGMHVEVFEAREEHQGYVLTLGSNGVAVLDSLGLAEQAMALGSACSVWEVLNGKGKRLGGGALAGGGFKSVFVKRTLLGDLLYQETQRRGITIHRGKKLLSITEEPGGLVTAHFADGSTATGDLLIGADGVHSRTRSYVDPALGKPFYTGLLNSGGYTSRVKVNAPAETVRFVYGKRCFFGYHVSKEGYIYWFTNQPMKDEPARGSYQQMSEAERREYLLSLFSEDEAFIREIIAGADEIFPFFLSYVLPKQPTSWHRGSVVLMGDAAHAFSPSSGQGGSMAFEDAIMLAKCLRDLPDTEQALTAYEQERRKRTEKIYLNGKYGDSGKHVQGAFNQWFRDLTAPFFMKLFVTEKEAFWLYEYRVDWSASPRQEQPA